MSILSYTVFIPSSHCVLFKQFNYYAYIVVLFKGIRFGVQALLLLFHQFPILLCFELGQLSPYVRATVRAMICCSKEKWFWVQGPLDVRISASTAGLALLLWSFLLTTEQSDLVCHLMLMKKIATIYSHGNANVDRSYFNHDDLAFLYIPHV